LQLRRWWYGSAMTLFDLFYGGLYLAVGVWVFNALPTSWPWWAAFPFAFACVIALHAMLVLVGRIGSPWNKDDSKE